jgi:hypothetical protein
MYDELSFADDHLLCIPANLIIPACINAPFLLILSEKERVHNLFTHAFVVDIKHGEECPAFITYCSIVLYGLISAI